MKRLLYTTLHYIKKNSLQIRFSLFVLVIVLFYSSYLLDSHTDRYNVSETYYYSTSSGNIPISTFKDSHTVIANNTYVLSTTLESSFEQDYAIQFFCKNADIQVTVDELVLYSVTNNDSYSTSSVKNWHTVSIDPKYTGHSLQIIFTPSYSGILSPFIDTIYAGNENQLLFQQLRSCFFPFIVSVLLFTISVILLIIGFAFKPGQTIHPLYYLGLSGFLFATYSFYDSGIAHYLCNSSHFLLRMHQMLLPLSLTPLVHYFSIENRLILSKRQVLCEHLPAISVVLIYLLFQLPDGYLITTAIDFAMLLLTFFISCLYCIQGYRKNQLTGRNSHYSYLSLISLVIGSIIDIIRYFFNLPGDSSATTRFMMLLCLLFVTLQYFFSSVHILELGKNSKSIHKTAYTDVLTGLGNRSALNEAMEELNANLDSGLSIGIVQLDINFLKRVNDTLGHLCGDRLIQRASQAISTSFDDFGHCYRFGGDEFIVILQENPHEKYLYCINLMEQYLEQLNQTLPKAEEVQLAYGIAYYDPETDSSIWKVQERADVSMYEKKKLQKSQQLPSDYHDSRL